MAYVAVRVRVAHDNRQREDETMTDTYRAIDDDRVIAVGTIAECYAALGSGPGRVESIDTAPTIVRADEYRWTLGRSVLR